MIVKKISQEEFSKATAGEIKNFKSEYIAELRKDFQDTKGTAIEVPIAKSILNFTGAKDTEDKTRAVRTMCKKLYMEVKGVSKIPKKTFKTDIAKDCIKINN